MREMRLPICKSYAHGRLHVSIFGRFVAGLTRRLLGHGYGSTADPGLLPADHFSALADLAPDKPFAVAETGWPAEDVTAPFPVTIPASETTQRAYVARLLTDADGLSAAFVMWFVSRDYDDLWESYLQFLPNAPLLRLWRDNGLYTGDGQRRPALETWRGWLARRRIR
jgi:hypothetical protein